VSSIEMYMERAEELAQGVVNAWGVNMRAGNAAYLTDEFNALLDKACRYRDAKRDSDTRRKLCILSELDAAQEDAACREFAEAYKAFWEKHQAAA